MSEEHSKLIPHGKKHSWDDEATMNLYNTHIDDYGKDAKRRGFDKWCCCGSAYYGINLAMIF